MIATRLCVAWLGLFLFSGLGLADDPVKLASEARIDISPDDRVGRLSQGKISFGRGQISRMSWLPADQNPCSSRVMHELATEAREWSDYFGRPVHMGEFGAYESGDDASRANYCRAYRKALEANGLGWALWDWSAGFRYWDKARMQPVTGFPEALFEK